MSAPPHSSPLGLVVASLPPPCPLANQDCSLEIPQKLALVRSRSPPDGVSRQPVSDFEATPSLLVQRASEG